MRKYQNELGNYQKSMIKIRYLLIHSIDNSKLSDTIYKETSSKVVYMITFAESLILKFTVPFYALPIGIRSLYIYFMRDASESAFMLTFERS